MTDYQSKVFKKKVHHFLDSHPDREISAAKLEYSLYLYQGQQTLQILMYWIMGQHSGQQLAQKEAALAESEQKTIRQRALYGKRARGEYQAPAESIREGFVQRAVLMRRSSSTSVTI